jgi:hypothetical protein
MREWQRGYSVVSGRRGVAVRSLRKVSWSRMDPVQKLTTLIDIGRLVPKFLWPATPQPVGMLYLSYAMKLRIALSALMWIRCLRDVQDTLARLHLPYARTSRLVCGKDSLLAADVFPTRNWERVAGNARRVSLWIGTNDVSATQQVPAPHTWNPETGDILDDPESEATLVSKDTNSGRLVRRETKADRLFRVRGIEHRPSDDDRKVKGMSNFGMRRRRSRNFQKPSCDATDERTADEEFHSNFHRREGCPLDDDGNLHECPIHIYRANFVKEFSNIQDVVHMFATSHASILSSLYIQGRVVSFFTDTLELHQYIGDVFAPLVDSGFLNLVLQPMPTCGSFVPYVPHWKSRHAWIAGFGSSFDAAGAATLVVNSQHGSGDSCTVIVASAEQKNQIESSLQKLDNIQTKWSVFAVEDSTHLQDALKTFSYLSIISNKPNFRWIASLPTDAHVVSINCHTRDALWFLPHAAFLPKKVGNAFRYEGVTRSVVELRNGGWLKTKDLCSCSFSTSDVAQWSEERLKGTGERADNALVLERLIDHLANPSKLSLLALVSAKFLGL